MSLHLARVFQRFAELLRRQPRWAVWVTAILLLMLVGYVDVITGPEVTVAQFYLVPLCLVTWVIGRWPGYAMALASAGVWLAAERLGAAVYTNPLLQEWNLLTRLAFFVASVWILSAWKTMGARLAKMVDERTAELRAEIVQREKAQADLRQLAAQLSAAEDAERRKLAYDIHDGLSQVLSMLKLNLEAAVLEAPEGTRLRSRLLECVKSTEALIRQSRTLTFDLHPAMLDDLGLVATLERYAVEFQQRTEVDVTVTETGLRRPLGSPLANYLFRAIKELMSNAVRHGRAKEIIIGIHWEVAGLRVVIDDDGSGFNATEAMAPDTRRGLGLAGIDERLTSLGGRMAVESVTGQGSRIILEVPLRGLQREQSYDDASLAG